MSENNKIIKNTSILMLISIISKPLAIIKEMLIASIYGVGIGKDAFIIAFTIPNLIFSLFNEGFEQTFIPLFKEKSNSESNLTNFISTILSAIFFLFVLISVIIFLLSPFLINFIAGNSNIEIKKLSIILLKILSFGLIFMVFSSFLTAYLHSDNKFFLASIIIPVSTLVVSLILYLFKYKKDINILAISTVIGFLITFLFLLPSFKTSYLKIKLNTLTNNKELISFGKIFYPYLLGTFLINIAILVERSLATKLPVGSISSLDYAFRYIQMIYTFFIPPVAITIYPILSKLSSEGKYIELADTIIGGVKKIIFIILPIVMFSILFSKDIITIFFERGSFTNENTILVSKLMSIYCLGLFSSIAFIILHSFYAIKKTFIKFKYCLIYSITNILMNLLLLKSYGVFALALGNTIGQFIGLFYVIYEFKKNFNKNIFSKSYHLLSFSLKILYITLISIFLTIIISKIIYINSYINFAIKMLVMTFSFFIITILLKIKEVDNVKKLILKKITK